MKNARLIPMRVVTVCIGKLAVFFFIAHQNLNPTDLESIVSYYVFHIYSVFLKNFI